MDDQSYSASHAHGWHASPDIRNSHHPTRDIEALLSKADFRAGFAALERLGLTFDCWGFHTQLGEVAELAQAFPGVTIILNHIGGLLRVGPYANRDDEVLATWRNGIAAVAQHSNVHIKLGGISKQLGERKQALQEFKAARRMAETATPR